MLLHHVREAQTMMWCVRLHRWHPYAASLLAQGPCKVALLSSNELGLERYYLMVDVHAKLSRDRACLCAQEVAHRRPYEVILLARKAPAGGARQSAEGGPASATGACDTTARGPAPANPKPIPDKLVLVACPQEHSRKPQLGPTLAPLLPPQPRCLEVIQSLARSATYLMM